MKFHFVMIVQNLYIYEYRLLIIHDAPDILNGPSVSALLTNGDPGLWRKLPATDPDEMRRLQGMTHRWCGFGVI